MNERKLLTGIIVFVVIIIGGILAFTPGFMLFGVQKNEPLKIGLVVWPGFGPYYVAQEKAFFDKDGISQVEFITVDIITAQSALASGALDVVSLTPPEVAVLSDKIQIKVIGATDTSRGADGIVAVADIKNIEDLKGKKIAVEIGTASHFLLLYLLDKAGLSSSDVILTDTTAPDAGVAFVSGDVDAGVTWEPWLSKAASEREGGHILATTEGNPIIPALIIVRDDTLKKKSDQIKVLMKGWYRGLEYIEQNPDESYMIMSRQFEVSSEEFREIKKGIEWFDYNRTLEYFGTVENPGMALELINKAGDLWVREGLTENKPNAKEIVDFSLLKNLYK